MRHEKLVECILYGLMFQMFTVISVIVGTPIWVVITLGVFFFIGGALIPYLGEGGTGTVPI